MIRAIIATPFHVAGLALWLVGGGVGAVLYSLGERIAGAKK